MSCCNTRRPVHRKYVTTICGSLNLIFLHTTIWNRISAASNVYLNSINVFCKPIFIAYTPVAAVRVCINVKLNC